MNSSTAAAFACLELVQFRFPRSRKRRIRRKWAKCPENFRPIPVMRPFAFDTLPERYPPLFTAIGQRIFDHIVAALGVPTHVLTGSPCSSRPT